MKPSKIRRRRWLIVLITLAILVVFVARLMKIQIVDADYYRQQLANRTISTQVIKAVRGEIVDSNGMALAANRMGYDIIIDMAFFPSSRGEGIHQQNEILRELIVLMEQQGEKWNDSLPLSRAAPFSFEPGYDDEIVRLRKLLKILDYATAEDAMYWLLDRYKLRDYPADTARKIAGVRYDMEQRGFNMRTPYTFAEDVDIATVVQVKERSYAFLGVDVVETASRYYPNGTLAPHIIGTIGAIYQEEYQELKSKGYALNDVVGKNGIESAMEDFLRGVDGKREIITDSYGEVIDAVESVPPVAGHTVKLTLDGSLQQVAQESLEAQIQYLRDTAPAGQGKEANTGAVVMLEVKTGKILASATYPSYDLSLYKQNYQMIVQDPAAPLVNRAMTGQYAPGSTFKPVVGLAGLTSEVIDPTATVSCGQVYRYHNHNFTCLGSHGAINLLNALRVSCNIFFYDVGRRAGIEEVDKTASLLGLGEPTGVEIYEAPGQRSNPEVKLANQGEEWYPGDTLQSSIGQLLHMYTPLQLANYTATIANRGTRMKLTLIEEILDYSTANVVQAFEPQIAQQLTNIPPEAFEAVINGMVAASRPGGTAPGTFGNYPITVASKTGTPETFDLPNSVFICFAPAEDPEVAIAVVIEKGWHGYTGAPVAKALFDEYFGIDVRSPLNNGPQRLKDQRAANAAAGVVPATEPAAADDNGGVAAEDDSEEEVD